MSFFFDVHILPDIFLGSLFQSPHQMEESPWIPVLQKLTKLTPEIFSIGKRVRLRDCCSSFKIISCRLITWKNTCIKG